MIARSGVNTSQAGERVSGESVRVVFERGGGLFVNFWREIVLMGAAIEPQAVYHHFAVFSTVLDWKPSGENHPERKWRLERIHIGRR